MIGPQPQENRACSFMERSVYKLGGEFRHLPQYVVQRLTCRKICRFTNCNLFVGDVNRSGKGKRT